MLSGNKNIDMIILNNLEDKDLVRVCRINKYIDRLCKDQTFWLNRILSKFPYLSIEILNKYKGNRSWSEYYINDLRRINRRNAKDYLMTGSVTGRLDRVIIALEMRANIHAECEYAIRWASSKGHTDIVRYLVEAGANIHANNDIAIRWASEEGHTDIGRYLAEAGANIHADDDYAIRSSSQNGHINTVKYLVEAGANIHVKNDQAINMASFYGHTDIVRYLKSLP